MYVVSSKMVADTEKLSRCIIQVAADNFHIETLNPDAIVGILERDDTMKLTGWVDGAWEVVALDNEVLRVQKVCDPYLCRRLYRFIVTGQETRFPWEQKYMTAAEMEPMASAVIALLEEGKSQ